MSRRYSPRSVRSRRRAFLHNQVADLILYGSLTTTETRAKIIKAKAEQLISRAKRADLATKRRVIGLLPKEPAVEKLFERIVPQFKNRTGGFVRVVKLPPRRGDRAPMARVEFVEKIAEPSGSAGGKQSRGKARKETAAVKVRGKKKTWKKEGTGGGLKEKRVRRGSASKPA